MNACSGRAHGALMASPQDIVLRAVMCDVSALPLPHLRCGVAQALDSLHSATQKSSWTRANLEAIKVAIHTARRAGVDDSELRAAQGKYHNMEALLQAGLTPAATAGI